MINCHWLIINPLRLCCSQSNYGDQLIKMKNICFIHIPKCGGTSIRSSMKKNWLNLILNRKVSLDHIASSKAAESMGQDVLVFREELLRFYLFGDKSRYVFGHFRCTGQTRELFQDQWNFITLIRDPVKRWLSHYYFDRYRQENIDYNKHDLDLEDYINSDEGVRNARMYARHFSSYIYGQDIGEHHVAEAINNILKFDVYGVLEHLDLFAKEYGKKVGKKLKIQVTNKNPKQDYKKRPIPDELMNKVLELCKYDISIYQKIRSSIQNRS